MITKPIAFYLPQFHPVKENSEWWGEGFTEWTNVAKALPNFQGHYQPHIPKHLGFYDLRLTQVIKDQATLAKKYGIYGFCFYHYWFSGREILETPINNFLASDIELPFCICWANENWTRRWDGQEQEILLKQEYLEGYDHQFFANILPLLKDSRYIRADGKPMILVYQATQLPNPLSTSMLWRELARREGLGDLHLVSVMSHIPFGLDFCAFKDPATYGFDALVEFPPAGLAVPVDQRPTPFCEQSNNHSYSDYQKAIEVSLRRTATQFEIYRGIMPSWDNTARRQHTGHTFLKSSPEAYCEWFKKLIVYTRQHLPKNKQYIFINAWNEWAEGAHLEPDLKFGLAYLEATQQALVHLT